MIRRSASGSSLIRAARASGHVIFLLVGSGVFQPTLDRGGRDVLVVCVGYPEALPCMDCAEAVSLA